MNWPDWAGSGRNLSSCTGAIELHAVGGADRARLPALLNTLIDLLRAQDDEELTDAFSAWAEQALLPRSLRGTASAPLPRLEEVRTMLAETVREWTAPWVAQGIEQGIERGLEQGRAEERALLRRLAARKFEGGCRAATGRRAGGRDRSGPSGAGRRVDHRVRDGG